MEEEGTQAEGGVLTKCSHHDGTTEERAEVFYYAINLEKRVRANHPLRRVKAAIDLGFVREEVFHCYGKNDNESVAPEVILKMMFCASLTTLPVSRS